MRGIRLDRYTIDIIGEMNTGEVITIPDQSLSVREILSRFRRGLLNPDSLMVHGEYNEACVSEFESDFIEEAEDLAEIYELSQNNSENDNTVAD